MIKKKTFKKLMGLLLATSLTTGLMVGCGSNKSTGDSGETNESEEATSDSSEEEPTVVTVGDENGTEFEMWTFVELHAKFYEEMVKEEALDGALFSTLTLIDGVNSLITLNSFIFIVGLVPVE